MSFLIVDAGTSNCRVAVVSEKGRVVSLSRAPITVNVVPPRQAEVDTDRVWEQVKKVVRRELDKHPDIRIEAVGVSAMLGYVFLDKNQCPLMPAPIWMDNRAETEALDILRVMTPAELYQVTGRRISSELLAPKILWLKKHRPETAGRIDKIIGLKDDLTRRLTGNIATDLSHANYTLLYNVARERFDTDLFAAFGLKKTLFPSPRYSSEIMGRVTTAAARETGLKSGIPVAAGSSDGTAAMYGGGVLERGRAVLVSGTTDVMMMRSESYVHDPSQTLTINNSMVPGEYLVGGAMGLSGGVLQWMEELLNEQAGRLEAQITELAPGAGGLLFVPALTGERAPYWKEYLSGALVGLTRQHGKAHIFRALMEGTSFRLLELLRLVRKNGVKIDGLNITGGCAEPDAWNRIRADVTGLEVSKMAVTEATVLGTAMFCLAGLDESRTLEDITAAWIEAGKQYRPDPEAVKGYGRIFELFDEYINVTEDISMRLRNLK